MTDYNDEILGDWICYSMPIIETFEANSGNMGINMYFEVLDGPDKGEVLRTSGMLTEKGAQYTIADMKIAGWQGTSMADIADTTGMGIKVRVSAYMQKSKSDGQLRRNVRVKKMVDATKLASKFDALIASAQQEAAVYQAEAQARDSDDVPF